MSDPEKPRRAFHPADRRSNPALRPCSLAARGSWIEGVAIVHRARPCGHLLIDGRPVTDTPLAVSVGAPPERIPALVRDPSSAGAFSRTRKGAIYSRRMTRDEKEARISRKNAQKGFDVRFCKQKRNPPWDNPPLKPPLKPKSLEVRVRVKKEEAVASSKKPPGAIGNAGCGAGRRLGGATGVTGGENDAGSRRGTRLPGDWRPDGEGMRYAAGRGFGPERIGELIEAFRDYWAARPGAGGVRCDWAAVWRTWVRNEIKFHGAPGAAGRHAGGVDPGVDGFAGAAAEVARRLRQKSGR